MSSVIPVPANERERLLALNLYALLDTPPEESFDRISELARQIFDVPIALVSLLGSDRQFFKSRCGLDIDGTSRDIAFCAYTILEDRPFIVSDATLDPRFVDNPLVTGSPYIRFYAGIPLLSRENMAVGTLCIIDTRPRTFSPEQVAILGQLAQLIVREMEWRRDRIQHDHLGGSLHEDPRVILDGISDAFIALDNQFRFRHLNRSARRLLKAERESLEGEVIWRVFPELIQTLLHDKLIRARTERKDLEFEHFFDAWNIWHRIKIVCVDGGLSVYMAEITNQVQKSQALRESEALKSAVLDASFDCIITIDELARIIEFNPAAERTFGYARQEVLGLVMTDLIIPPHFRDAHTRGMAHYMRTGEGPVLGRRIEISALRRDGTEFPVELAISPILLENDRRLFTAYVRDITQRKEDEQTLRDTLEKERKLGEMKSRFVAQASHEFRTPLSMIRSSAQLIRRVHEIEPEKIFKYLERIEGGVGHMIQLLEDLLLLSQAQSTDWPIHREPTRLDLLVQTSIEEILLATGKATEISLRGNIAGVELPIDRKLMRLILNNLITNAIKYASDAERPIDVHAHVEHDTLTVCIADQGIGVPEHELTHLFDAFHRADNVGTRPGTGIGLAIVKSAIDRLSGSITVASMENQGTTFTCTIPLSPDFEEVTGLTV